MICRSLNLPHAQFDAPDWSPLLAGAPQLVLAFFSMSAVRHGEVLRSLQRACAGRAALVGCSTAGEISPAGVTDDGVSLVAIRFEATSFRAVSAGLPAMEASATAGAELARQLSAPDLRAVMLFAPGVAINGSALIEGAAGVLGPSVPITGGLAGDDGAFVESWTLLDDRLDARRAVALGFYGPRIDVAHGSFGGWQPFGPVRTVTRAAGNVLFEIDGEPALDIYRRYLGDYARELPASGLLFPFALLGDDHREIGLIRTILGIDEAAGSLILAGDVTQGGALRLMHASTKALIDGAQAAAQAADRMRRSSGTGLALLISCVGRKLVMGGRVDEEVEAVAEVFGSGAAVAGFYSNGEISPFVATQDCRLHNQTMTVTYLSERAA